MIVLTIESQQLELSLAFQHELERVAKVCLGLLEGFSLRYRSGNLFYEAGVSAFSGWFKYCRKLHAPSVSQGAIRMAKRFHGW